MNQRLVTKMFQDVIKNTMEVYIDMQHAHKR